MNAADRALFRRTSRLEYTLEPTDAFGDILDPLHYGSRSAALNAIPRAFADFPEAVYVDFATVTRKGSNAEGETSRVYDYQMRWFRDGTRVALATDADGLTPLPETAP